LILFDPLYIMSIVTMVLLNTVTAIAVMHHMYGVIPVALVFANTIGFYVGCKLSQRHNS
jgi:intracellular septation protein A